MSRKSRHQVGAGRAAFNILHCVVWQAAGAVVGGGHGFGRAWGLGTWATCWRPMQAPEQHSIPSFFQEAGNTVARAPLGSAIGAGAFGRALLGVAWQRSISEHGALFAEACPPGVCGGVSPRRVPLCVVSSQAEDMKRRGRPQGRTHWTSRPTGSTRNTLVLTPRACSARGSGGTRSASGGRPHLRAGCVRASGVAGASVYNVVEGIQSGLVSSAALLQRWKGGWH